MEHPSQLNKCLLNLKNSLLHIVNLEERWIRIPEDVNKNSSELSLKKLIIKTYNPEKPIGVEYKIYRKGTHKPKNTLQPWYFDQIILLKYTNTNTLNKTSYKDETEWISFYDKKTKETYIKKNYGAFTNTNISEVILTPETCKSISMSPQKELQQIKKNILLLNKIFESKYYNYE